MSKRTTPAKSAATKRAAFAGQRQQFAAKGRVKSYGLTKAQRIQERDLFSSFRGCGFLINGSWTAI